MVTKGAVERCEREADVVVRPISCHARVFMRHVIQELLLEVRPSAPEGNREAATPIRCPLRTVCRCCIRRRSARLSTPRYTRLAGDSRGAEVRVAANAASS